jgi:cell division protein FtsZ
VQAAQAAISSPLLEDVSISGAMGVLVNITGGENMSLHEVNDATTVICDAAGADANIIFGAVIDPAMGNNMRVTVIATGFHSNGRSATGLRNPRAMRFLDNHPNELEVPTYQRRTGNGHNEPVIRPLEEIEQAIPAGAPAEDYEVPAFLRKRQAV